MQTARKRTSFYEVKSGATFSGDWVSTMNRLAPQFGTVARKAVVYGGDETDRRPIWAEEIGTRAHALALCVAYDSPLMTLCDWPERYRGAKGVEALRALPTAWRETRPFAGAIGEDYGVVRETFDGRFYAAYLGVAAKDVTLPLDFLPAGETWEATVYADGPRAADDATDLAESTRRVTRETPLTLAVAPEGGFVAVFRKVADRGSR